MSAYQPPIASMQFWLEDVFGFTHEDLDHETITAILDEAAKLARDVLAPLNRIGDEHGATLDSASGGVTCAPGFQEAYAAYRDGGWNALPFSSAYGGQDLPWALAFAVQEMWQGANMSFGLCPLLNQGAVEALSAHGSPALQETYLEKLISGEWTGTMNLTEPQAGSDLSAITAKAVPAEDDSYRISGQKIFITYGEHNLAENIIHLVLARLPDAPEGVKGISLFVVPKVLPDSGARNALRCIGLEHKLGIHASPTCTMEFDGAIGYLVGAEHQGLSCMFTMMNNARLSVGLQGVAIAERAYQHAAAYAAERVQGKGFTGGEAVTIDQHPDVQRMLSDMRARIAAGRALTLQAAMALDSSDPSVHVLTPLVKSWCTDMAVHVASTGVQIHGGMGFIEESGAAQYYRDARILPIYEGTNGIQAADLVFRKIRKDGGALALAYIETLEDGLDAGMRPVFAPLLTDLRAVIATIAESKAAPDQLAFAAADSLNGFALIAGGALLARSLTALESLDDKAFAAAHKQDVDFFIHHILPQAGAHLAAALYCTSTASAP